MSDQEPRDDLVSDATKAEQAQEATEHAEAGRGPTPEEEAAAERSAGSATESVKKANKEATKRGANVQGEGEIP